jgi:hypothetical protein
MKEENGQREPANYRLADEWRTKRRWISVLMNREFSAERWNRGHTEDRYVYHVAVTNKYRGIPRSRRNSGSQSLTASSRRAERAAISEVYSEQLRERSIDLPSWLIPPHLYSISILVGVTVAFFSLWIFNSFASKRGPSRGPTDRYSRFTRKLSRIIVACGSVDRKANR